ncbi:efflux RND transporter periplasmic adaptor subunit [Rhizorhapis suberifaciens]|uniref:RND family efflux transporter MFP subunit n=1 Tax=Rhizorhapis suberifaciens TaxID=13656 RepID=A0A840HW81_9SPHN|nr:efflux RND transporter periplasmic adaptor subunit [Rhizorhapis suberifaciens]MBB4641931.1 RND family efflux transporter MFP subunit [Rhizorhapis suberifaciens]
MRDRLGWKWIAVTAVILVLLAAYLLWKGGPRELKVATARTGTAVELVYATGFVEPEQPVSVAARVTAPVMEVLVEEGQHVRRGQALVRLADDEQRASMHQAGAERIRAVRDEARVLALYRQGWVTRAARDEAIAAADSARAAEQTFAARRGQYVIRAGIDAIVLKRDVEPGDLASPSRILMTLGDPAKMRITAAVDERDVPRIRPGQEALMSTEAYPGRIIRGRVREITPGGDPTERAFRVRLLLERAPALPLGLTLEVNVVTGRAPNALLVPASAVDGGRLWVVVGGQAKLRRVRTGITGAEEVQILRGLRAGEQVVLDPPDDLDEGDKVKAKRQ